MFKVEDSVVYITRGDDATLDVSITSDKGEAYEMQDGDRLVLTVRALPSFDSDIVFAVESTSTTIVISHADTASADVGQYSADIQLVSGSMYRTIWPELEGSNRYKVKNFKNFVIMPEVSE